MHSPSGAHDASVFSRSRWSILQIRTWIGSLELPPWRLHRQVYTGAYTMDEWTHMRIISQQCRSWYMWHTTIYQRNVGMNIVFVHTVSDRLDGNTGWIFSCVLPLVFYSECIPVSYCNQSVCTLYVSSPDSLFSPLRPIPVLSSSIAPYLPRERELPSRHGHTRSSPAALLLGPQ